MKKKGGNPYTSFTSFTKVHLQKACQLCIQHSYDGRTYFHAEMRHIAHVSTLTDK
jgi:hypothetical protein